MSTKALRKELFAAVAMLIVAAIALSGSTYAWFAANTTVTAEDMKVTVVSDQAFLLIKQGLTNDPDEIQAAGATVTSAALATSSAALRPVSITDAATSLAGYDTLETSGVWYYEYSSDPGQHIFNDTGYTELAYNGDEAQYVLVNEFSITVADGSNPINNLKVSNCTVSAPALASTGAVTVIVATDTAHESFTQTTGGAVTLATTVDDTHVIPVKIFIYWDGADDAVFTNNVPNLLGTEVSVSFSGEVGSRN